MRCNTANDKIGWLITDVPSGAMVQVHDGQRTVHGLLHLPFRLDANATISVLATETGGQTSWRELLSAGTWAHQLSTNWIGATDAVKLTVQGTGEARTLELRAGTALNASFSPTDAAQPLACLLNSQGQPLSPWLHLQGGAQIMEEKTGERLEAWAVTDAHGERCGWLLAIAELRENPNAASDAQPEPRTGWLLIVQPTLERRFVTSDVGRWGMLLRSADGKGPQGWLHSDTSGESHLRIETGEAVALRSDFRAQGFAVGSAPEPGSPTATVFAVLVLRTHLVPADGEPRTFEPRKYLPQPPPAPVFHPPDVIARIRKNQARLGLRVDNLLQMLGGTQAPVGASGAQAPSYLHSKLLDTGQRQIWEIILRFNDDAGRPRLFTPSELRTECQTAGVSQSDNQLVQTVMLLVRLGLIVEAHLDQRNGYRRVQVTDLVQQEVVSS